MFFVSVLNKLLKRVSDFQTVYGPGNTMVAGFEKMRSRQGGSLKSLLGGVRLELNETWLCDSGIFVTFQ